MSENEFFPTMAVQQAQHVNAVECRTFFNGLIIIYVCNILQIVVAPRFVVGILHLLANPNYGPLCRPVKIFCLLSHREAQNA
jgi:hypothetical protein